MIHAFGSRPHYLDHLEPIWYRLAQDLRGTWHVKLPPAHQRPGGVWMVASYDDARALAGQRVVYVEHGAGQTYAPEPGARREQRGYSGGPGLDHVALFVCPSATVAARWTARYPRARVAVVGCPKLDVHHRRADPPPDPPTVAFTWHFNSPSGIPEAQSALGHYQRHLSATWAALGAAGVTVVASGHPRVRKRLQRLYGRLGVAVEWSDAALLRTAHLLVADNTSLLYEFASLDRPVVVLNAPTYRRHVHHGLRFWDQVPGRQVDGPEGLAATVLDELDHDTHAASRREAVAAVYDRCDGHASQRAATAIEELLP